MSVCPICLSYNERRDGCMYISHKCTVPRHEALYAKFKDDSGMIEWCTVCGRVTSNHRHYRLSDPTDPVPARAPTPRVEGGLEYSAKKCIEAGGGGYKEKVKRFNRLLEHAAKLQSEVGKMLDNEARDELVEEMWRAARGRNLTDKEIETILQTRKFTIPEGAFPTAVVPTTADSAAVVYPDILRPVDEKDLTPIEHKQPDNLCAVDFNMPHDDNRSVWQFRHKQPDGSIYDHTYKEGSSAAAGGGETITEYVCAIDLESTMRAQTIDGKCPLKDRCKGVLYPEEIKGIVSPEWYEIYRKKFNEIMRPQRGGGLSDVPILRRIDDASVTCSLPRTGARRLRTYRKKRSNRMTRGQKKRV